jgi:hypothetical protein
MTTQQGLGAHPFSERKRDAQLQKFDPDQKHKAHALFIALL